MSSEKRFVDCYVVGVGRVTLSFCVIKNMPWAWLVLVGFYLDDGTCCVT